MIMKIYLGSVIIWSLILKSTEIFTTNIIKTRNDIDYKKYIKNREKKTFSFIIVAFIPVIRLIFWLVMIWLTFCRQEDLDKLLGERNDDK